MPPKSHALALTTLTAFVQSAYEIVRHTTESQQRRQKSNFDRRLHGTPYKGDVVWLYVPHTRRGQTSKLYKPWQGPYKVIKKISEVTYRIQSVTGRKRQVVQFNRLKPCSQHLPDDRHDQTAEPCRRTKPTPSDSSATGEHVTIAAEGSVAREADVTEQQDDAELEPGR